MLEIIGTEIKSDLLNMYRTAGDLLNYLEVKDSTRRNEDSGELLEMVKSKLMDITGTLQKDIYNCDYILSKAKVMSLLEDGEEAVSNKSQHFHL
ncbi:MAG: hypothetical protein QHH06_01805 [Clostridiales bacterium]|nr:hypothetical protein [Eubacteriales bacterium]MDH7565205.1 hypothetical protein [Clostridiales bacterium]